MSFVTTATTGRNRSTAISSGYDVFAAGQARAAAYEAAYRAAAGGGSGNEGHKDEEGSYSDSSCDIDVDGTETLELSPATRKLLSPSTLAQVDRNYAPGQKKTQRSVTLRMNMMAIRYAVFLCVGLLVGHTTHTGR